MDKRKYVIIVFFIAASFSMKAQVEGYTLDSIIPTQNRVVEKQTSVIKQQPQQRQKQKEPQLDHKGVMRTLFGLAITGNYAYTEAPLQNVTANYSEKNVYNDGAVAFEFMTPIINFKQSFSFNYFSNSNFNNMKYEKTHIDFLGLTRMQKYITNYNKKSYLNFYDAVKWLPIFDRRLVKTLDYSFNEMRIGGLAYNIMSYKRTAIHKNNVPYMINEKIYEGFTVDIVQNQFTLVDLRGVMDYTRLVILNNGRSGMKNPILWNEFLQGFLYQYSKLPNFYINFNVYSSSSVNIHDKYGNHILKKHEEEAIGFDIGITYSPRFFIKKANMVIIPDFAWSIFDYSVLMKRPNSLYVGIDIQFYL